MHRVYHGIDVGEPIELLDDVKRILGVARLFHDDAPCCRPAADG